MKAKHILHIAGATLSITGLVYVALLLKQYSADIDIHQFDQNLWLIVVAITLVYCILCLLLTFAWRETLIYLGTPISRLLSIQLFGLSQLAKYAPGNVLHYVGRQALAQAEGINARTLVKSSLAEVVISVSAAALFTLWILPHYVSALPQALIFSALPITTLIGAFLLARFLHKSVAVAFTQYSLFFISCGTLFLILLIQISEQPLLNLNQGFYIIGAFVIAWFAGFIIPGAPAGLGVREVVLMTLLQNSISHQDLLLTIIFSRIANICGEILFFALAVIITKNRKPKIT